MRSTKRLLSALLLVVLALSCIACGEGEFDYQTSDLGKYLSFGDKDYHDVTFSVEKEADVTDTLVLSTFNSYFSQSGEEYYQPIADATRAIKDGDRVYLYYCGILTSVLEEAVAAGRIPDTRCTGMTYDEIVALKLGFEGGTASALTGLTIGSDSFIDGFEDGLLGIVPAEHGNSAPLPLSLTFPQSYAESLAGKDVVFFCDLYYIGNSGALYTYDTLTVARVNEIFGRTGEEAFASLDDCLAVVREGLQEDYDSAMRQKKCSALWEALADMATFQSVPQSAVVAYAQRVRDSYMEDLQYLYEQQLYTYITYFQTADEPGLTQLAAYLGLSEDNFDAELQEAVEPAVRQQMVFWYLVRTYDLFMTDAEIAAKRAEYQEEYGEDVFDGYEEQELIEQFLYDKVSDDLITYLDAHGQITYTKAS